MSRRRKKTEQPVEQGDTSGGLLSIVELVQPAKSATVNDMANCVVRGSTTVERLETMGFKTKNQSGMTFKEAIIARQIEKALRGDLASYRAIMDYADKEDDSCPLFDFVKSNSE